VANLVADNLVLGYDTNVVLKGINLEVPTGELMSVVGTNGSGKSTLLRAFAASLAPRSGQVRLDGQPVNKIPSMELARKLVFLPQGPPLPKGFYRSLQEA